VARPLSPHVAKLPRNAHDPSSFVSVSASLQHDEGTHHGHSVRTRHIGDSITGTDAQGEFVVLTVDVTNHGKTAQLLDSSNQKLLATGKTYDADGNVFADSKAFLNNINPGNRVTASIAFDVPKGTRPTQVVLHDSAFSNGVRVTLR
jgi:hypothetical protein